MNKYCQNESCVFPLLLLPEQKFRIACFFSCVMPRESYGGLYKAQAKEVKEIEKLRGEKDHKNFIALRFVRWQVVGLRKAR